MNSEELALPPRSAVLTPAATAANVASRMSRPAALGASSEACERSEAAARIIAIGFAMFFPASAGCGSVRGLRHQRGRIEIRALERDEQRLGARDRAVERQDEVGEDVAVAVQSRDHERLGGRGDEEGEGRVDQLRLVRHVGMPLVGCVHLLLEHPLVGRRDGVLGTAEHLRAGPGRVAEGELGHGAADGPLDPLGAERNLVLPFALTPFLCSIGLSDGHPHHRDRGVHAAERDDAGNAAPGADDDLPADLLAEDQVRRADVSAPLGRDGRGLQAEPVPADRRRRVVDDGVLRGAAVREREVVARKLELDAGDVGREHAERLLEQLLPGVVALEDQRSP